MGNVAYTAVSDVLFGLGGNRRMAIGTIAMSNSYATGGDTFNPVTATGLTTVEAVLLEQPGGYLLEYTSNKVKAYLSSGSPTISGEAAHTHAVALDGGASAAEAAHTHAVALDGGASDAEAAHTHAVALDGGASAVGSAHGHAVTGITVATEGAHTHPVALDGGASAAEAAHTHGIALDGGASAAGSAHGHAVAGITVATEGAHTHAVALDSGASAAGASHNHVFTGNALGTHQHDAITAGTPAGTNATSVVTPRYQADLRMVTKPVIALTHNANPAVNLLANPLYIVEAYGESTQNVGVLQSNNNGAANILGETANGTVGGIAASCRFFVLHNAAPAGVQIYIDEAAGDRLEFVSPTTTDGWIIMTIEAAAGAPPGFACAIKVYHDATAATGKALSFDDNGVADAQLIFVDAGAAGGTIPAGDIIPIAPIYNGPAADALGIGRAAAQVFSGSALGTHQHAVVSAGTPAGTNAAEATHTHASGTLADAASGVGSAHTHVLGGTADNESAHTHGPGTLTDTASGVGSSHTHGPGTLADTASGVGVAHTHVLGGTADNESAHTHGPGTLADVASGVGSSHTHGPGTLADAASGVGASHTHGPGTLTDAASAAGSSHTHTATAEVADEVTAATDLSAAITSVAVLIIGT